MVIGKERKTYQLLFLIETDGDSIVFLYNNAPLCQLMTAQHYVIIEQDSSFIW